jgi:hypothetical protein
MGPYYLLWGGLAQGTMSNGVMDWPKITTTLFCVAWNLKISFHKIFKAFKVTFRSDSTNFHTVYFLNMNLASALIKKWSKKWWKTIVVVTKKRWVSDGWCSMFGDILFVIEYNSYFTGKILYSVTRYDNPEIYPDLFWVRQANTLFVKGC